MSNEAWFAALSSDAPARWVWLRHRVERSSIIPHDASVASVDGDASSTARVVGDHFDLMFADHPGLRTWAVDRLPGVEPQLAWLLPVHRTAYLDYQGVISGGRGEVERLAAGTFTAVEDSTGFTLELNVLETSLAEHLVGRIERLRIESSEEPTRWSIRRLRPS